MTPACLYLNLELSLCELYCNGYVVYQFLRMSQSSIQRNDRKIFPLNNADTTKSSSMKCNNSSYGIHNNVHPEVVRGSDNGVAKSSVFWNMMS
jgi:hypothetical protein